MLLPRLCIAFLTIILISHLFVVVAADRSLSSAATSTLGQLRQRRWFPYYGAYIWKVSVDPATGCASAQETSRIPKQSPLHRRLSSLDDRDLLAFTERLTSRYPIWLCSGPVTLGLLRAVPISSSNQGGSDGGGGGGGYEIQSRLFSICLLRFGAGQGHRLTYRQGPVQTTLCTVSVPMTGGFLTMRDKAKHVLSASSRTSDKGWILFSLSKQQTHKQITVNDPALDANVIPATQTNCAITTALDAYRPWILGHPPVHPFRKWVYCSTQSVVHGYIMWRFHRHLWNSCSDNNNFDLSTPQSEP